MSSGVQSGAHAQSLGQSIPAERRSAQQVRECFEEGCQLLAPFFDPAARWGNAPLDHLAMRVLRERFATLSSSDLLVMLNGIRGLYARRRTPSPASDA